MGKYEKSYAGRNNFFFLRSSLEINYNLIENAELSAYLVTILQGLLQWETSSRSVERTLQKKKVLLFPFLVFTRESEENLDICRGRNKKKIVVEAARTERARSRTSNKVIL